MSKIQGLTKASPTVFKDLEFMKNTDLSVKIQDWDNGDIGTENLYKIFVPIFGAAYAAPNKGTTILYWFRSLIKSAKPYRK